MRIVDPKMCHPGRQLHVDNELCVGSMLKVSFELIPLNIVSIHRGITSAQLNFLFLNDCASLIMITKLFELFPDSCC